MKTNNRIPKYTTWAEATISPFKAVRQLLRCLRSGYNAWIELQENGDQFYPIRIKNPKLDREESWKVVGTKLSTREQILADHHFFNDTTRRLTMKGHEHDEENDVQAYQLYKPKGGIANYVTKPLKRKVFVVCFNTNKPTPAVWVRLIATIEKRWKLRRVSVEQVL